jgi:glutaredoxin-related protein
MLKSFPGLRAGGGLFEASKVTRKGMSTMKKVFLFGSEQCPDCITMKEFLDAHQVRYSFIDILGSLGKLKMFLKYRDTVKEFEKVREKGSIGIPFLIVNDGEWYTLDAPSEAMLPRLKD